MLNVRGMSPLTSYTGLERKNQLAATKYTNNNNRIGSSKKYLRNVQGNFKSMFIFTIFTITLKEGVTAFIPSETMIKEPTLPYNQPYLSTLTTDVGTPTKDFSTSYIDPLLISCIENSSSRSSTGPFSNPFVSGLNISLASNGVRTWKECLRKGRFPIDTDFVNQNVWPEERFYSKLVDAMTTLELPRFVLKHPETVSAVLLTLIRLTLKFKEDIMIKETDNAEELEEEEDYYNIYYNEVSGDVDIQKEKLDDIILSNEDIDALATEIADCFIEEWNDVVSGVNLLDQLFGYDHGLLDIADNNDKASMAGFGLEDGVWKHTGWKQIPALQDQISDIRELKELMKSIGRRPTAENSEEVNKFAPRKLDEDGSDAAQFDPQMRESVGGIALSGSLTEMLPSEAVLLKGSPSLRRLFLAKKAESKLLSYEMSGWCDVPSIPVTKPLYLTRMPSAPGGPIIVCLDTSWSMSGMREQLSKAVVLACVTMAHKQKRQCQVVAFSTESQVIEAGVITPDAKGIERLLNFLSSSFGGGTDVTGALKYAMETLDSDVMSAADILLISDGEIPDPPVNQNIMEALDRLKLRKGVEVHGLLVGKRESKPLSRLCTETHDFLVDYDISTLLLGDDREKGTVSSTPISNYLTRQSKSSLFCYPFTRSSRIRKTHSALQAKYSSYDEDVRGKGKRKKIKNKGNWNDSNNDYDYDIDNNEYTTEINEGKPGDNRDEFNKDVEKLVKKIKLAASESSEAEAWNPEILQTERESVDSCWKHKKELDFAIEKVCEGLVERQEEARLVVLAMLSREHILLLGVPGTGKSILGRRLSKLCNGNFFQRLLTKFTTPEELFGPLSLKSLENDEYRRCTSGFLPTASIAFLDEIFKANSAILNTLLTILNERKFDNAGGQEDCPIKCVVGASNELPESDELIALFDRFLIRKEVLPVSDEGVIKLLSLSNPGCDIETDESCDVTFIEDLDDIVTGMSLAAKSVEMGLSVCEFIRDMRTFLKEDLNVEISDRRLVKAGKLLQISAASHGRKQVDPIDCLLLQHIMWNVPEQRALLRDWIWENITPGADMKKFRLVLDSLRTEVSDVIRRTSGDVTGEFGGRESDITSIKFVQSELNNIASILQNEHSSLSRHMELMRNNNDEHNFLWLHPDEMRSIQQLLLPRAEKAIVEVEKTLNDCRSLELCLQRDFDSFASLNEMRLSAIERLWEEGYTPEIIFTDEEMNIGMKEAKKKYDLETFRKWKRAKKRLEK